MASAFSMVSLKRRAFNQHLIERISQYLAKGRSLEKSSPEYEQLCTRFSSFLFLTVYPVGW